MTWMAIKGAACLEEQKNEARARRALCLDAALGRRCPRPTAAAAAIFEAHARGPALSSQCRGDAAVFPLPQPAKQHKRVR